jgi:hypothetical protein
MLPTAKIDLPPPVTPFVNAFANTILFREPFLNGFFRVFRFGFHVHLAPLFRLRKDTTTNGVLFPGHGRSAIGTLLFITGAAQLMGCSFTAVGANARTTRSCRKTTAPPSSATSLAAATAATTHASTRTSTGSRSLASRACSVSSWHCFLPPPVHFLNFLNENLSRVKIRLRWFLVLFVQL